MIVLFLASLLAIALVILWLPVCTVALLLRRLGVPRPFSGLRLIMPVQLVAVAGLVALAAGLGLRNPAGYTLAITLLAGVTGAVALWRWRRPAA